MERLVHVELGWVHVESAGLRIFAGWLLIIAAGPIITPSAFAQKPAADILFDIPAQPLAAALDAYSAATGRMAAYNGNLAEGRISGEVKGRLSAEVALLLLLRGSGLVAQRTTVDAFVVVPTPDDSTIVKTPFHVAHAALARQNFSEQRYSALIQASISNALCGTPGTRPGSYRLAISFRIGSYGEILRPKLLSVTGDPQRDAAIIEMLLGVALGEPPPSGMEQPFTMVVLPRSSGGTIDCPVMESKRRHG